jgi:hypothetical protein
MEVGRVSIGYPWISGQAVSVAECGFRPWIFEFGYMKVSNFEAVFDFHPWITVTAKNNSAH